MSDKAQAPNPSWRGAANAPPPTRAEEARYTVVYEGDSFGCRILNGEPAVGRPVSVMLGDMYAAAKSAEAEVARLKSAVDVALNDACQISAILLMAGEMTAQERRTARAVAEGLASKVRAALHGGDHAQ